MNVLFASILCSEQKLKWIFEQSKVKPAYATQKFSRLICRGLDANSVNVETISSIPVNRGMISKMFVNFNSEIEDNVKYNYCPVLNMLPGIKNLIVFVYSFVFTFCWCLRHKDKSVICDILQVSNCVGALLASKLTRTTVAAIVTDMPGFSVSESKSLADIVMMWYINSFDKYILLTEQMNELINTHHRPYIVMEGLVDSEMKLIGRYGNEKKVIIYAGGLYEKYGIKMMIDAYMQCVKAPNIELHLYGDGDMVPYIKKCCSEDCSIVYYGSCQNSEIVEAELGAYLLVNPRFTHEVLTRYSFPSKNMEYMVSGTPVLTTKLPGMPKEYCNYVFLIEDETIEGFVCAFQRIFKMPDEQVADMGINAKQFVLQNKNNIVQAKRIVELIKG